MFAIIREGEEERTIRVSVKRFSCRACDRIINADEPFYPGTRIGSPVIDLCLSLAMQIPVNRTAAWLDAMGVIIDRTSCRLYARDHARAIPTDRSLWYQAADLGDLTFNPCHRTGQLNPVSGAEVLAACNYPSAGRSAPSLQPTKKQEERDAEEEKKERARVSSGRAVAEPRDPANGRSLIFLLSVTLLPGPHGRAAHLPPARFPV